MQLVETLLRKVLASVGKHEIAIIDSLLLSPARIKHRRVDRGHARDVGIRLGRHIQPARPRSLHHRETFQRIAQATAVDVDDMQRGACNRRRSNHLAHRFNRGTRFEPPRAAHMGVDRQPPLGREPEHVNHFQSRRAGCVLNAHSNRQSASVQFRTQPLPNRFDLFRRSGMFGCRPALRQDCSRRQRCPEHRGPCRYMAR